MRRPLNSKNRQEKVIMTLITWETDTQQLEGIMTFENDIQHRSESFRKMQGQFQKRHFLQNFSLLSAGIPAQSNLTHLFCSPSGINVLQKHKQSLQFKANRPVNLKGLTPILWACDQSPFSNFFLRSVVVMFSTEFFGFTLIRSIHRLPLY